MVVGLSEQLQLEPVSSRRCIKRFSLINRGIRMNRQRYFLPRTAQFGDDKTVACSYRGTETQQTVISHGTRAKISSRNLDATPPHGGANARREIIGSREWPAPFVDSIKERKSLS